MRNHAASPAMAPTPTIPPTTPPTVAPTSELFEVGVEDPVLVVETGKIVVYNIVEACVLVDSDVVVLPDSGEVALDSGKSTRK
jgi:hypothetical protein